MSITKKFKPGDAVVLNSGGPTMTVVRYDPADGEEVVCQWFNKEKLDERAFHQDVIRLYEPITPFFSA